MGRRRLDPNPSPDPFGYAVFGLGLGHEEEGTAGKKGTTTILRSPLLPKTLRPVCDRHVKEVVNTLAAKINEEMRFSGLLPHVSHAWKKTSIYPLPILVLVLVRLNFAYSTPEEREGERQKRKRQRRRKQVEQQRGRRAVGGRWRKEKGEEQRKGKKCMMRNEAM